jgi:cytoskeleton protein RodZ
MSLEALERSDLARLPGGIFTRSFIRAYAQEVGLDPDSTIEEFIAELPAAEVIASPTYGGGFEDGEALESSRKAVATAMRLMVISLPIAGFLIFHGFQRSPAPGRASQSAHAAVTPAQASTAVSNPMAAAAQVPAAPVSAAVSEPQDLTMEIAPKADCWVSVTVDGEQLFSAVLHAGDRRSVNAHDEISLTVGDAGAFVYTLNGKPGRALGARGEVVSRRMTPADAKSYIAP